MASTNKEVSLPQIEAPKVEVSVEAPKAPEVRKSYEQIGQERMQKAKDFISGGFSSLKEKTSGFMGGLKKFAEKAVGFTLTLPERIADAGRAVGRAAKRDWDQTGEDFKAVGRGAKDLVTATGRGIERGVNVTVGGVEAGVGKITEVAKTGKEFIANRAMDAVITARSGYERVVEKGRELADRAKSKVNGAVDSFNGWRNERRMERLKAIEARQQEQEKARKERNRELAAHLLEIDRPKLDSLLLLVDSI